MKVLLVGRGKGSWEIRGLQLGAALGARIVDVPTRDDWRWCDVAVLVKGAGHRQGPAARAAGVPFVWDALDCWRQPSDNRRDAEQSLALLTEQIDAIRPTLTLGATQAQAAAAGGVYAPHHSFPPLTPTTPARPAIQIVAYQGDVRFLGAWRAALDHACAKRGWRFVVNPPDLRAADLIVALRAGEWDGWMCREWKSGVKLVNAIAAGRPVLMQATAAQREIDPPGSVLTSIDDLASVLDAWQPFERRQDVVDICAQLAPAYELAATARAFQRILDTVYQGEQPCAN